MMIIDGNFCNVLVQYKYKVNPLPPPTFNKSFKVLEIPQFWTIVIEKIA